MLTLHLSSLIKFLIGMVFLQGSTGLLVYTALRTDLTQTWPLFCTLGGHPGGRRPGTGGALTPRQPCGYAPRSLASRSAIRADHLSKAFLA